MVQRGWSQAFFLGTQCQNQKHWAQTETQKATSEHENMFLLWG